MTSTGDPTSPRLPDLDDVDAGSGDLYDPRHVVPGPPDPPGSFPRRGGTQLPTGEYPPAAGAAPWLVGPDHGDGYAPGDGSRRSGSRRARRAGGLAIGVILALGTGGVFVASHLRPDAQPKAVATGRMAGEVQPDSSQPDSSQPPPKRMLGGPITTTAPQVVTSSPRLTWAPPELTDPITETVTPDHHSLELDTDRDYVVQLPRNPVPLKGGVTITGGHNVVVIGGEIHVPRSESAPDAVDRRAMYLKGQTGTVHVEGVHLTGDLSDGFNLDERDGAVVQIQNVQIDLVHGSHDTHHADVIQTWAGPRVLRVDGLRAATEYQGFFLLPDQRMDDYVPDSFVFRRTVLSMMPHSAYALWLPGRTIPWMDHSGIIVRVGGGEKTDKLSWPDHALGLTVVNADTPVDLPEGTPGGAYQSPGYAQSPGY